MVFIVQWNYLENLVKCMIFMCFHWKQWKPYMFTKSSKYSHWKQWKPYLVTKCSLIEKQWHHTCSQGFLCFCWRFWKVLAGSYDQRWENYLEHWKALNQFKTNSVHSFPMKTLGKHCNFNECRNVWSSLFSVEKEWNS